MRPVVNAMVVVVVVPMMRRVRQGNVCEKNQRGREPNNLNHDCDPQPLYVNAPGVNTPRRLG
jgi:hypothetical protein